MTPCEKLGYKEGDEFEIKCCNHHKFYMGERVVLCRDDGSTTPTFVGLNGYCHRFVHLDDVEPLQVTLRPGDYVSTKNMTESEYHDVARAFMWAGAHNFEYPNEHQSFFGWSGNQRYNFKGLYHGTNSTGRFTGRLLTIEQVINATNSGTQTSSKNLSKTRGVKTGEMMMHCKGSVKEDTYWGGEGLPPVGTVCECMPTGGWVECKVVAHRDGYAVARVDKGNRPSAPILRACHFRPLRTERETWVEAAGISLFDSNIADIVSAKAAAQHLYDAMLSGKLAVPNTVDTQQHT